MTVKTSSRVHPVKEYGRPVTAAEVEVAAWTEDRPPRGPNSRRDAAATLVSVPREFVARRLMCMMVVEVDGEILLLQVGAGSSNYGSMRENNGEYTANDEDGTSCGGDCR
jgi:hypothetical protein